MQVSCKQLSSGTWFSYNARDASASCYFDNSTLQKVIGVAFPSSSLTTDKDSLDLILRQVTLNTAKGLKTKLKYILNFTSTSVFQNISLLIAYHSLSTPTWFLKPLCVNLTVTLNSFGKQKTWNWISTFLLPLLSYPVRFFHSISFAISKKINIY